MLRWLIGIILVEIICESSNWQHIQRLKITILGANWQHFRLERIAKCSYFILSTQIIKFYWFVMKIKEFLLPIWWYNRGLFPLGNKYFGVFVLNGLKLLLFFFLCVKACYTQYTSDFHNHSPNGVGSLHRQSQTTSSKYLPVPGESRLKSIQLGLVLIKSFANNDVLTPRVHLWGNGTGWMNLDVTKFLWRTRV